MFARRAPLKPSARQTPAFEDDPEEFAGKYRLVRLLRRGTESAVHEAEELKSGRRVALKVPYARLGETDSLGPQFAAAARAMAQMAHPNIVAIYDFGVTSAGSPYIAMEMLEGETLDLLLSRRGALAPAFACELMVQVLSGLTAAHRMGIVHRGLEPYNIFVTYPEPDQPTVKLLEFGATRSLVGGQGYEAVLGDPAYLAPEQARGNDAGPVADVYAAAVILYELLAGEPPFSGDRGDVLKRVIAGQWKPLSSVNPAVPRLLTLAISAAMATDPSRRIASARVFAKQLAPYLTHARTHSAPQASPSAAEFILGATSALPDIKVMSTSDLPDPSRPPRDFPSLQLARVAGKPKGEPLADSLLQSPIIPKAPTAPKIQLSSAIRDLETWSMAPEAPVAPDAAAPAVSPAVPTPVVAVARDHDPVFDSVPAEQKPEGDPEGPPWNRGAWAAAFGVGVGALLAWLYRLG